MPHLGFSSATTLTVVRATPDVVSMPVGRAGRQLTHPIPENIHKHVAALQGKGITDLSNLG